MEGSSCLLSPSTAASLKDEYICYEYIFHTVHSRALHGIWCNVKLTCGGGKEGKERKAFINIIAQLFSSPLFLYFMESFGTVPVISSQSGTSDKGIDLI